ncbi:MAG TPA: PAS domain-containing protein, partial [Thalassobaculum sp.]
FIRLRLAGSAVVADYGQEITGRNYLDFVEAPRRPKASHAIHAICRQPAAMLVQLRARTRYGRMMMRESVAFPMRDEDGVARLIYFCSSQARERDVFTVPEPDSLQFMDVARRVYFDIGAGLPDHQD